MQSWTRTIRRGCVLTALGIVLAAGSGCELDDAAVDGVEDGLSDAVSATVSQVVLGLLGIE